MTDAPAKPATQRLFFALWPGDATREQLRCVQQRLGAAGGRRVHPEDLHITLAFLGPVGADRLPCVLDAAGRVAAAPLQLTLDRQGWWRGPRVAWCAPSELPEALPVLVDWLWTELTRCGFEREARPYRPHVTLLRKTRGLPGGELEDPIPWEVREFVLVTSLSEPGGPRYKVLQRWPLAAPDVSGLENQ